MRLPLPPLPFAGALDVEHPPVDRRMYGWTADVAPPVGEGRCIGAKREMVTIHLFDRVWISLRKKPEDPQDPKSKGLWECRVQHKAEETYADGPNLWQVRWLGLMSWLLLGRWLRPSELHAAGWNVSRLDLNSDFVRLSLAIGDTKNFMTTSRGRVLGHLYDGHASRRDPYLVETLELGRESSDVVCKVYQKSTQLRDAKRVDPAKSMYAPLWRANGWDGESDVTRVEWVLTKKGLIYTDPDSGDIVVDFRDPAALLDPEKLRHVWEYLCTRRRLILPGTASRKTRCLADPAWIEVARLGVQRPRPPVMRQVPRWVRAMTRDERVAKDMLQAGLAAVRYMSRHDTRPVSWADVGAALQAMGRRLEREAEASEVPDVFGPLPQLRDVDRLSDYAKLTSVFFAGEAHAHREEFLEEIGRELPSIDWGRVPITTPPDERATRNTT